MRCVISDAYEWQKIRLINKANGSAAASDAVASVGHLGVTGSVQPLTYVGGLDISFVKGDDVNACTAFIIIHLPSLEVIAIQSG